MSSEVHVNDIGTQFIVTVKDDGVVQDISTATNLILIFKKPDQTTSNKTATLYTDGTDGKMTYTSVSGDLNQAGNYKIQGKVTLGGATYYTSIGSFKVHCNL